MSDPNKSVVCYGLRCLLSQCPRKRAQPRVARPNGPLRIKNGSSLDVVRVWTLDQCIHVRGDSR